MIKKLFLSSLWLLIKYIWISTYKLEAHHLKDCLTQYFEAIDIVYYDPN